MSVMCDPERVWGYRWRSSKAMAIICITIALISDTFLYSFIVPILGYMVQERVGVDTIHLQFYVSAVLATFGFVSVLSGPIVGHLSDKIPDRRTPMLIALVGSMVGTSLLACARSMPVLFLGRALQAVNGSVSWVIGLATIADRVDEEDVGKVMGSVMALQTAGPILGPMVSGFLFETVGYWMTWSAPLVMLLVDFIARLLMVEVSRVRKPSSAETGTETSALISSAGPGPGPGTGTGAGYDSVENVPDETGAEDLSLLAFYRVILSDMRALTALSISSMGMLFMTSLDATLPLHVQEVFGWGPSTSGFVFFCFSVSTLVLTPLSGWLYDRVGPKYPLTICVLAQVLFGWILGIPRSGHYPWADPAPTGPRIFIAAIVGAGGVSPFLSEVGILGLTSFVKERQTEDPNVFGPHGGFGRAYALNEILSTSAMMAGPILSGILRKVIGYYYMNVVFAVMFMPLSVFAFWYLRGAGGSGPGSGRNSPAGNLQP